MIMRRTLFTTLALLLITFQAASSSAGVCDEWNLLDKAVRDRTIPGALARQKVIALHELLLTTYGNKVVTNATTFPVKGYGVHWVGGKSGNGYRPSGYSFYDGNRHGGHPAHDIFIRDRNQDCLDDVTGAAVEIVAFTEGVVVATNPAWEYPSTIRGGKYVWIFQPATERYHYYAHLADVAVSPGDLVTAGDVIGHLGRTGKNAYPRRSPTHLHFMTLSFANGRMVPWNSYRQLLETGGRH